MTDKKQNNLMCKYAYEIIETITIAQTKKDFWLYILNRWKKLEYEPEIIVRTVALIGKLVFHMSEEDIWDECNWAIAEYKRQEEEAELGILEPQY